MQPMFRWLGIVTAMGISGISMPLPGWATPNDPTGGMDSGQVTTSPEILEPLQPPVTPRATPQNPPQSPTPTPRATPERSPEAATPPVQRETVEPKPAPQATSEIETLLSRGQFLLSSKQYEDALRTYDSALELNSNNADAWIGRGMVLEQLARYDDAIAAIDRATEISPNYSLAWLSRGMVLKEAERFEDALTAFDRALAGNGQWGDNRAADAALNRGSVLWQLDRRDDALASFDRALELDPQFALAWYNKATALLILGDLEAAVSAYDSAINSNGQWGLSTGPASAWYNRGLALEQLERYDDAIASYNQALRITPNHTQARQQLTRLRQQLQ